MFSKFLFLAFATSNKLFKHEVYHSYWHNFWLLHFLDWFYSSSLLFFSINVTYLIINCPVLYFFFFFFAHKKLKKTTLKSCSKFLKSTFFSLLPWLPKRPKVIIEKSGSEGSLMEQDTIENVFKKKKYFFNFILIIMPKMFSSSTMFLRNFFCPWKHEKNCPQKLLIISPIFFPVLPTGPNPAQISIPVP